MPSATANSPRPSETRYASSLFLRRPVSVAAVAVMFMLTLRASAARTQGGGAARARGDRRPRSCASPGDLGPQAWQPCSRAPRKRARAGVGTAYACLQAQEHFMATQTIDPGIAVPVTE